MPTAGSVDTGTVQKGVLGGGLLIFLDKSAEGLATILVPMATILSLFVYRLSSDTQIYDLTGHPDLRMFRWLRGRVIVSFGGLRRVRGGDTIGPLC